MIDIETLGLKPYSVITSIGAVAFNIETGEIVDEFLENICVKSSTSKGLSVDADTILWWMKMPNKDWMENPSSIEDVFLRFKEFMEKNCDKDSRVWANSPAFDLNRLEEALELTFQEIPTLWDFRNEMCVRTLNNMFPEVRKALTQTTTHNALEDCKEQIKWIVEIWRKINPTVSESKD